MLKGDEMYFLLRIHFFLHAKLIEKWICIELTLSRRKSTQWEKPKLFTQNFIQLLNPDNFH